MRRLTLDYDGNLRLHSMDNNGTWIVSWMAYSRLCYVCGLCGLNGICVYTPAPTCTCAPGYKAIDPSDRRKGCKPKFTGSCNGRQKMRFVKLPSTDFLGHDQDVHHFVSIHTCKNICMSTCRCKGFRYLEGTGDCYTKFAIVSGVTEPDLAGSTYIKLPGNVEVLESSIPHSQPFGPKYSSGCSSALRTNVTADLSDTTERSHSGSKYWYVSGFLSAIFLVEVIFLVLGWWFILRREGRQLRSMAS